MIILLWWAVFLSIRLFFPKDYPAFVVPDAATILLFFADNIAVFWIGAYEPKQKYQVYRGIRIALTLFPMAFAFFVFGI